MDIYEIDGMIIVAVISILVMHVPRIVYVINCRYDASILPIAIVFSFMIV